MAGGERVQRRRLHQPHRRQALGGAAVQRRLLVGRQAGEALLQLVARQGVHAQPVAGLAGDEDRRVARPAAPAARRRRRRRRRCGRARDAAGRGWRCGSGSRRRPGSRLASSRSTKRSRRAPLRAAITDRSKRGSLPAAIAESASCRPSGQPSVSSCRRAAASRSTRLPKRARASSIVSSKLEAQLRRADDDAGAVGDEVVDLEAAVGPRRDHRAQVGRRVAQQVGQGLARGLRQVVGLVDDEDDVDRRVRHFGEPDRHAFEAARGAGGEQGVAEGRPACAERAPRAPGSAGSASARPRSAPTATPRSGRAPGARGAIAPSARSCRSRPVPAPG